MHALIGCFLVMIRHYHVVRRCPWHIQSVFNLDNGHHYGHLCYGQSTAVKKGIH